MNILARTCVLVIAVLTATVSSLTYAQTNTFSGRLSLPPGLLAGVGGATFEISAVPIDMFTENDVEFMSTTTVTIPRGFTGVTYSLTLADIPAPAAGDPPVEVEFRRVAIHCLSGCENLGVITLGYWNSARGIVSFDNASEFDPQTSQIIDIDLERADIFEGVVNLPDGFVATGDEQIRVIVRGSSFFTDASAFSIDLPIVEGQSSWPFLLGVPSDETGGGWNVEMRCVDCEDDIETRVHFPTRATGDPMTLLNSQSFFFQRFNDFRNMQMTFISNRAPDTAPVAIPGILLLLLDED